jgi:hypothetical protein
MATINEPFLDPEDWLFSALFDMVEQHCGHKGDSLSSFGWRANARAMRLLAGAGFIEIDKEDGNAIESHTLSAGRELMARLKISENE